MRSSWSATNLRFLRDDINMTNWNVWTVKGEQFSCWLVKAETPEAARQIAEDRGFEVSDVHNASLEETTPLPKKA